MPKIAVFVDVQNIYYTTRQAYGQHFNYKAFWQELSQYGEIVTAYAYAIERADTQQLAFQEILRKIGFTIKLKPYIQRSDGSAKGDWDVGITLDIMEEAAFVDTVVLASGDGDFDLLLERASTRHNVETIVYGTPSLTANSLQKAATRFRAIDQDLLLGKKK
jgi:uncharacterized LabA/DUF88 family protein